MVTGHSLHLMVKSMKENRGMVKNMVKEFTIGLIGKSMWGNGRRGKNGTKLVTTNSVTFLESG